MSANTKIEWCDHTFNPWEGCTAVGPGCDHCYAEARNTRFNGGQSINWGPGAPRRRTSDANWRMPLKWNRAAEDGEFMECPSCGWRGIDDAESSRLRVCTHCGTRLKHARPRVFCASLADVFDNQAPAKWRDDLFGLVAKTPHLDWLLLTKRIGNVRSMLAEIFHPADPDLTLLDMMPLPNVWIGATVVNQSEADRDIPKLLAVPAARRFLSVEPMLGEIDLVKSKAVRSICATCADGLSSSCIRSQPGPFVDWVICGGESGPHARPMHPDWPRELRDQCAAAGVPFLFKQWGEWAPRHDLQANQPGIAGREWFTFDPDASVCRVGKKAAGRRLDGREHNEFPESAA